MLKITISLVFFLSVSLAGLSQRFHVGLFGGASAYLGELTHGIFPKKVTNGVIGATLQYELTEHIMLRGGYNHSIVGGADRFSRDEWNRTKRNLSFETRINEFSLLGEYYLLDLNEYRFTPYAFVGLAVFRFDPYAYDTTGNKVFLRPLSTEGQGMTGYPDKNYYSLTQLAIPIGGGVKYAFTPRLRLGLEIGLRKTFTDYIDDVSTNYADQSDLQAQRGQLAADMAFRADELGGGETYPQKGDERGNPKLKDFYYFTGLHLSYQVGGNGGGSIFNGGGKRNGKRGSTACPVNVY